MRILFATAGTVKQGPAGPASDSAATRYRVLIPAAQLSRLGHQATVAAIGPDGWHANVAESAVDAVVVSRHPAGEALARRMKARGVRVVLDIGDEPIGAGQHVRSLAAIADEIVSGTESAAEAAARDLGKRVVAIPDPVEGPRGVPAFAPRLPALRVLWFGEPPELGHALEHRAELAALAKEVRVQLSVVTAPSDEVRRQLQQLADLDPAHLGVDFMPATAQAAWSALARCDLVWLPGADAAGDATRSPNRLLEALWAGRFVVADASPAYHAFGDLVAIGTGLPAGAKQALDAPEHVVAGLKEAQRRIARGHSPFECGRRWAAALGDATPRPLRLNLGCGDKILPGYVNVDVVEARAGMKPDVVCDLHDLAPFSDDCADEILSVHVVEHFWRWEVRDVMREWVRVLKPGGRMVIECPNLLTACATFLENPQQYSREDQGGQRTMWVFYGDPKWKDPLMIHRWGYTPESLKALLAEAGLAEVRQEPAQFKLREPRDMRIVGVKP